jgi:hypothetical protein
MTIATLYPVWLLGPELLLLAVVGGAVLVLLLLLFRLAVKG